MELNDLIEKITMQFRKEPRNKVFASQELLIASVSEESGQEITPQKLLSVVRAYEDGDIDGEDEELYDAAVYCCGVLARKCFGDDPEDDETDVDYDLTWLEDEDGSVSAEVRPS